MSNHNKQGFLDRLNFHKAMDIIALAQLVSREGGRDINFSVKLDGGGGV